MSDDINFKRTMEFAYGEPGPMSPGVVRIVANNPSVFTFKGTNTYLVGTTSLAVIDPGPDNANHLAAIQRCAGARPISHILITHAHRDHIDGAPALKAATGAPICAYGREDIPPLPDDVGPSGKKFINADVVPDIVLRHGATVTDTDWSLTTLHTPGHAPDHLCFALNGRQIVFTGDHIMAWNTTVIAPPEGNMSDYMDSLELLLQRQDKLHLPGHGARITQPMRTIKAYLVHRRWREQTILDVVKSGASTVADIVPRVYDGLDARLNQAAALSVLGHVERLIDRGLLTCDGALSLDRHLFPV